MAILLYFMANMLDMYFIRAIMMQSMVSQHIDFKEKIQK